MGASVYVTECDEKKTKLKNALFFRPKCLYDTLMLRISPPKLGPEHAVVSGHWLYVRTVSKDTKDTILTCARKLAVTPALYRTVRYVEQAADK